MAKAIYNPALASVDDISKPVPNQYFTGCSSLLVTHCDAFYCQEAFAVARLWLSGLKGATPRVTTVEGIKKILSTLSRKTFTYAYCY